MRTVDAVKGKWAQVFNYFELPPITGNRHFSGECPICKRKGKFRIDDKDGTGSYICVCGSGSGWDLLEKTQGKDFKSIAQEIDVIIGNVFTGERKEKPQETSIESRRKIAIERFKQASKIRGTNAEHYFRDRGINELPTRACKFSGNNRLAGSDGVIYSIATNDKGEPFYLHCTHLMGCKKADIEANKKMYSLQTREVSEMARSIAIRLFDQSSVMGIAEGLETALSCKQIYGISTWSTMNAGFMRKFIAPKGVNKLFIFADNDKTATGHAAAFECANKNLLSNNDVTDVIVRWVDEGDFNDYLINGGKIREMRFSR